MQTFLLRLPYRIAVVISLLFLSGCTTMQSALSCPDDPFDPAASGACRLLYTNSQQKGVINTEKDKTVGLESDVASREQENANAQDELAVLHVEVVKLEAELEAQEQRTIKAEQLLAAAKESDTKSAAELAELEEKLAGIKTKLSRAGSSSSASKSDVDKLENLKNELEKELDSLLSDL